MIMSVFMAGEKKVKILFKKIEMVVAEQVLKLESSWRRPRTTGRARITNITRSGSSTVPPRLYRNYKFIVLVFFKIVYFNKYITSGRTKVFKKYIFTNNWKFFNLAVSSPEAHLWFCFILFYGTKEVTIYQNQNY